MESKSGATRGMMLNGKSFGMSSHGRFILKLTAERAAALVAEGVGQPYSPAPGSYLDSSWSTRPSSALTRGSTSACRSDSALV